MLDFCHNAMLMHPMMSVSTLIETISQPWAIRAILSSLMIGLTCGMLGCFIVLRNMSLIGDALSHSILPGIFVAFLLFGYSTLGFFMGSVAAGLLTAVVITWIQQNVSTKNDAAIGIVFTCMFSIGVIGITYISGQGGVHLDLQDFLFGEVLSVSNQDLTISALVTLYVVVSIVVFYRYLFITTFQPTIAETMGINVSVIHYFLMLMLSFAVVSALRSVGVILVVAMLITPASTALLLSHDLKKVIGIAGIIGMVASLVGMVFAILFDTPPGPAMVILATLIYLGVAFFSTRDGILVRYIRKRKQRVSIEQEDILRQGIKYPESTCSRQDLIDKLGYSRKKLNSRLSEMVHKGLVILHGSDVQLTEKGKSAAQSLVRAHRLWESYQVSHMGLKEGQIHAEADRLEHHLTEEILEEVDSKLGHPVMDPHGSPIPQEELGFKQSLLSQSANRKIYLRSDQPNEQIESELWELGLQHKSGLVIKKIGKDYLDVIQEGKSYKIPAVLARNIAIKN